MLYSFLFTNKIYFSVVSAVTLIWLKFWPFWIGFDVFVYESTIRATIEYLDYLSFSVVFKRGFRIKSNFNFQQFYKIKENEVIQQFKCGLFAVIGLWKRSIQHGFDLFQEFHFETRNIVFELQVQGEEKTEDNRKL